MIPTRRRRMGQTSERYWTLQKLRKRACQTEVLGTLQIHGEGIGVSWYRKHGPTDLHPSGEAVRWQSDGEPARVDGAKLKAAVATTAAAALLARHYPPEAQRREAAAMLGGWLASIGRRTRSRSPGSCRRLPRPLVMVKVRPASTAHQMRHADCWMVSTMTDGRAWVRCSIRLLSMR